MIKRFLAVSAAAAIVAVAGVFAIGWPLATPVQTHVGKPPEDLGARPVEFKSDSGAIVHGWWCPTTTSRGAVLLLPGIRANRLSMVHRARFLRRAGYSVLLIDFQATGETKGDHITFGWKESRDVNAAVDFIHAVDPQDHIAIIGSSLGGVAALLATPPLKVDALVLEAVLSDHRDRHAQPDAKLPRSVWRNADASSFGPAAAAPWRFSSAIAAGRAYYPR